MVIQSFQSETGTVGTHSGHSSHGDLRELGRAGIAQAQLPEGDPGWSLLSPAGRREARLALLKIRLVLFVA